MGILTGLAVAAGAVGAAGGVLLFAPLAVATIGYTAVVGVTALAGSTATVAAAPVAGLVMVVL